MNPTSTLRYCGRDFTAPEMEELRRLMVENPGQNRVALSRMVCERFDWLKPDGGLKQMSCRVAMLRMHEDGLIHLPPPQKGNGNGKALRRRTIEAEWPLLEVDTPAGRLLELRLRPVADQRESYLWNELIDRYHYLRYTPLPGAQLRYFAESKGEVLALLGFGAAAWKTAPRDRFIGWTPTQREASLHLIVNNARFLILPWVKSKNLASKLLGLAARRLPEDWEKRYNYRPVMMETFVETQRFQGTCYKAANWIRLGETKGRGKLDTHNQCGLPVKSVWIYPLDKNFRSILCAQDRGDD
jgi:hypothetical protein